MVDFKLDADTLKENQQLLFAVTASLFGGLFLWRALNWFLLRKYTALGDLKNTGRPREGKKIKGTAVVCGGSLAGLMAARVLSTHFDKVVVLESEDVKEGAVRKNVMQYEHFHAFFAMVVETMRGLYPDFDKAVKDKGGRLTGFLFDYWLGNRMKKDPESLSVDSLFLSRQGLEEIVRKFVETGYSNIEVRYGAAVSSLEADKNRITSVKARMKDGETIEIDAALVVDASGPAVASRKWLQKAGFESPRRDSYHPKVTYACTEFDLSKIPERDDYDLPKDRARGAIVGSRPVPKAGQSPLSGWVTRLTGDRVLVCTGTWGDDSEIPKSVEEFPLFFENVPVDERHRKLLHAAYKYNPDAPMRRAKPGPCHYVDWVGVKTPDNFIAVGDAVQRLNAQYGQGVSQLCICANTLDGVLRANSGNTVKDGFSQNYFQTLKPRIFHLWETGKALDYGFASTEPVEGETRDVGLKKRTFLRKVSAASTCDWKVTKILFEGNSQVFSHPWTAYHPRILAWVTYFNIFGMPPSELKGK